METSKMTVKQLQEYIREQTKIANIKLYDIYQQNKIPSAVQTEIEVLKTKGIVSDKTGYATLKFRGKSKDLLEQQARELEYFSNWQGTETKVFREQKDYKKYLSLKKKYPNEFGDYTYQQWRDLVEMFGTVGDKIEQFGYENIKQLHIENITNGRKVNMVKLMDDVLKSTKGLKQEDAIDILRDEIYKSVNKHE